MKDGEILKDLQLFFKLRIIDNYISIRDITRKLNYYHRITIKRSIKFSIKFS